MITTAVTTKRPVFYRHFYQSLRAFSLFNLILPVFAVVGINRIIVKLNMNIPTSDFDLWFGSFLALIAFGFAFRVLFQPIVNTLTQSLSSKLSMFIALVIVSASSCFNPALNISYFNNVLDKGKICEAIVEQKFKDQIKQGTVNFYQKVYTCTEDFVAL